MVAHRYCVAINQHGGYSLPAGKSFEVWNSFWMESYVDLMEFYAIPDEVSPLGIGVVAIRMSIENDGCYLFLGQRESPPGCLPFVPL